MRSTETNCGTARGVEERSQMYESGVLAGGEFVAREELMRRSARGATALEQLGVGAGDAVAILMRNDFAFFEAAFAAGLIGAAPVPVNWHGSAEEVAYVLEDSGAKLLVAHADLLEEVRDALPAGLAVRAVPTPAHIGESYAIAPQRWPVGANDIPWSDWIESHEPWSELPRTAPWGLLYTSGTTGRPKGVRRAPIDPEDPAQTRTLATLLKAVGLEDSMRTVITGPMYHTAPFTHALHAVRLDGLVVVQPRFDPEELLALVERHRITHLHMVPTMFVRLLALPEDVRERYDTSSLRRVAHAAAPCPAEVKRAMIDWWGPVVEEYYGGTESGAVTSCTSEEWLAHPGTVGRPLECATVRILGEGGRTLGPGEIGDVFMRNEGYPDFEYLHRPEATAEVERDGLLTCGDIGYQDEEGFLFICDRRRDMIISGGVNVYPAEIESCLTQLEGVQDCAVFGIPDPEFGEAIAAIVEPEPGASLAAEDVVRHVRLQLAGFKAPRHVEFRSGLPREDSGKIFKRKLREPFWAGTGRSI
jgi:long-chain acyl-CoA synthetase